MFSPYQSTKEKPAYSLYTPDGERKYLNGEERLEFIQCAQNQENSVRLLCLVLVMSGCRLSEALNLTQDHILTGENVILIRSLKKRGEICFRHIPVPHHTIAELALLGRIKPNRLFNWKRTRALFHVQQVMQQADITGIKATARGLRHTFGVHGIRCGIPLTLLQRWFGHAKIETTAIYTQIQGPEEREIAKRMW